MNPNRALLAILLLTCGCADDNRQNVLLVTFDTTRADRLSCYGYFEPSSPNVDQLAEEGALFTNSFTTNPITLPSHTSIMTGTYPLYHGVRDNSTYTVRENATTLAEILTDEGYDTAAFVGAFVLDSRFNLDQGFAEYDDRIDESWSKDELDMREFNAFGFPERKAGPVTKGVLDWLRRPRSAPFFLWVHYFDPHQPVNPPEPHRSIFSETYVAEIAYADEQLGQILGELKNQGEYDRTLIVMTSDHGEGLLDHGEPTHSLLIFDTTMRVPLVVRAPDVPAGQRLDQVVSGVDIMPSVLDLLGLEIPDEVQGESFAPVMLGRGGGMEDRAIYMESFVGALQCNWGALRGLRTSTEKLIHGPKPLLYAVGDDPAEIYNLAGREPERLERMTADLERYIARWAVPEAADAISTPDEEVVRKLAALGYIGGGGGARGMTDSLSDVEGKTDPYESRSLFDRISVAREDLRVGKALEGVRGLNRVLHTDPGNPAALTTLGKAYFLELGRMDLARENLELSLESDPYQEEAHHYLSRILRGQGDLEGARRHAEAILEFQPHSVRAFYELAAAAEAQGDLPGSREYLERLLAIDSTHVYGLVAFGASHVAREELDEAEPYFKRAVDFAPDNPLVLYNVGIWHWLGGNVDEARLTLERVVRIAPAHLDGLYALGRLLYEQDDALGAREYLLRARALGPPGDLRQEIDERLRNIEAFVSGQGTGRDSP
jgi:arylsulfatase A-like enzyme/tetratricopeptide (TPR) repeat protein